MNNSIIENLYKIILDRKENPIENSYTNYLFSKGIDKILKKVGEESTEVIIAAKGSSKEERINEICDLTYHLLVLMAQLNIDVKDVKDELIKRESKIGNLKEERKNIEVY
ncbi:MAG: phosphoribosyl-ATP diphosphatase [Clostridium perfringens]|nr:phosphoribosyl-ATP diphosphatase [Clostridium perfringens]